MGRTGLYISEISLGSWLTYGNSTDKETAVKVIDTAYSLGINYFDTANVYANGRAEVIVGEALKKYPRESYILATKAFWRVPVPTTKVCQGNMFLSRFLKRLNVDYIDIFYCHRYDPETPLEETLRTIDDLLRQGGTDGPGPTHCRSLSSGSDSRKPAPIQYVGISHVLTGKYKPGGNIGQFLKEDKLLKVEKLKAVADEMGLQVQ